MLPTPAHGSSGEAHVNVTARSTELDGVFGLKLGDYRAVDKFRLKPPGREAREVFGTERGPKARLKRLETQVD